MLRSNLGLDETSTEDVVFSFHMGLDTIALSTA